MERAKIDPAYMQPTNMAEEGARQQPGKDSSNPCDAKGNPNHFIRNQTTLATEEHDVKELRDKQLDSNFMQCAGFDHDVARDSNPAPRRGFKVK